VFDLMPVVKDFSDSKPSKSRLINKSSGSHVAPSFNKGNALIQSIKSDSMKYSNALSFE